MSSKTCDPTTDATVALTIERTDDDVDGTTYRLTPFEARAVALLIGTGLCTVSIECDGYRRGVVDDVKTHLQRIV